jgi:hypothetical protein
MVVGFIKHPVVARTGVALIFNLSLISLVSQIAKRRFPGKGTLFVFSLLTTTASGIVFTRHWCPCCIREPNKNRDLIAVSSAAPLRVRQGQLQRYFRAINASRAERRAVESRVAQEHLSLNGARGLQGFVLNEHVQRVMRSLNAEGGREARIECEARDWPSALLQHLFRDPLLNLRVRFLGRQEALLHVAPCLRDVQLAGNQLRGRLCLQDLLLLDEKVVLEAQIEAELDGDRVTYRISNARAT